MRRGSDPGQILEVYDAMRDYFDSRFFLVFLHVFCIFRVFFVRAARFSQLLLPFKFGARGTANEKALEVLPREATIAGIFSNFARKRRRVLPRGNRYFFGVRAHSVLSAIGERPHFNSTASKLPDASFHKIMSGFSRGFR